MGLSYRPVAIDLKTSIAWFIGVTITRVIKALSARPNRTTTAKATALRVPLRNSEFTLSASSCTTPA